jgi:gas vesicle protein
MSEIQMNNDSNKSGGNFFSGFIIGALVGAAVVFFLGTKKGKKLLKVISEEGMDNLNNLIEKADKATGLEEVYEEEIEPAPRKGILKRVAEEAPKVKRFFKGISRHSN